MKYANLGHTGLRVSRICLGCMSYGTPKWRPWVLDEEASQPFFRRAVELGVTFFDTANMYSDGVSEEVTGRALRKYAKMDEVVLATKVYFPTGSGQNERGLSRKAITQACEASLKRLGVDTIDLYQIHRMDPNTPIEETLSALDQLVRQGKVRYLGASSAYAWQFMRALSVSERNGWARFVSMQNHYNLVYREEEREMLPLCEAEGVGVIPWSPLARGLLAGSRKSLDDKESTTRAGSDTLSPILYNQPGDWDVVEAVKQVAEARKAPPAQVSLAWLLSKPVVTAPIIGATKPEHLEDAVKAVSLKLTPEEVKALEAPYKPHAVRGL
ncbi:aldo/keto reductase [Corallococcus aberystwythensis]|uniref:Aldo/keto reductase n=1 Tax=Corallococcus aberystwythensis TaxID=2316722 RepID=A0A3A8PV59_9BACT|nr:aldo/keto reductase [Corallococcus aberystwythensis]RKH57635.1 aldo/keto reductase [Corallococcus aberystwythensis]